jgi:hypothetical protein
VQTLEEIQKRSVFSAEDVKENEGKEDFQEDEGGEPTSTPTEQEEDEQIEEE